MGEANIKVVTGVSWLHDHQLKQLQARSDFLKDAMARGVPYHEYINFVGRHKECLRQMDDLRELFADFHTAEEEEDDTLGEITDDE
jgi:hypothetical protein